MITNLCYNKDYEVPIKIVDDYSYNSNIQNANYKLLNPLYVYCNTGVQWTLTGSKEFYGPVTFYNITFNLEGVNYSQYLRLYGNCNYKFIKCTFNLKSNAHYILIGRKDTHIAFIDCTFNILDTSLGTNLYLYNPIQPNPIITFTNNVVQEGITIITNYQISKSSLSSINKKLGEDFLVDGTNYATYDGTDVINPDGTLYSKVSRVKTASEISSGVANGHYKIISDIDLTDSSLTIPYNSILDFDGGRILNGTLNVNNATLLPYGMNLTKYVTSTISNRTNFAEGQIFYDSSIKSMKVWNGTNWVKPDGTVI